MLSEAGRQYERSKRIKPMAKPQREKIYKSAHVKVAKHVGEPKFSPFNTVSREARDSYLLRVTHEPVTNTNYSLKYQNILPLERRSTIDRAKFERIIGDVKNEDYSIQLDSIDNQKCIRSYQSIQNRPLTVRETHNWRKTFEHFDFRKQPKLKRLELPHKLSMEESTNVDFMNTLLSVTQSNFNNYERFSFKPPVNKAHDFKSNSGHEYLKEIQTREKSPEYNILAGDESIIRPSLSKTKGEKRFYKYKQIIATRLDRSDPNWQTYLIYNDQTSPKIRPSIVFDQTISRQPNLVHSKYPIRLSLSKTNHLPS